MLLIDTRDKTLPKPSGQQDKEKGPSSSLEQSCGGFRGQMEPRSAPDMDRSHPVDKQQQDISFLQHPSQKCDFIHRSVLFALEYSDFFTRFLLYCRITAQSCSFFLDK
ncbi:hypothetical protein CHARACLAT_019737 [Characodon lateralis]|uniref:Uncharacterized protein n=1 Tax=Characodon lateralis TaxID=208331 RepID=A0ABU7CTL9_9TELE|nr:hypothetical protein [Characodon lateralis]